MALIHPRSLERWQEWQGSRHRLRQAKHALTELVRPGRSAAPDPAAEPVLHRRTGSDGPPTDGNTPADTGRLLIGVDSATPSSRASLLTALPYLQRGVDVLAPADVELPELVGEEWSRVSLAEATGRDDVAGGLAALAPGRVLTLGHHLPVGRAVHDHALAARVPSAVVQHGALTPFAPPLPAGTTLLAWSDADGAFHTAGRGDVEVRTVGSQLLWQAAHEEREGEGDGQAGPGDGPITFLGQMHGAELPRTTTASLAYRFCRREGAHYRPHPAEVDLVSRQTHRLLERRGITIDPADVPLRELTGPVVGIFSTGVLEAAVRGTPAYVVGGSVPHWVREFWERYGMRRWGGAPTPAPAIGADEPARLIAQVLEGEG